MPGGPLSPLHPGLPLISLYGPSRTRELPLCTGEERGMGSSIDTLPKPICLFKHIPSFSCGHLCLGPPKTRRQGETSVKRRGGGGGKEREKRGKEKQRGPLLLHTHPSTSRSPIPFVIFHHVTQSTWLMKPLLIYKSLRGFVYTYILICSLSFSYNKISLHLLDNVLCVFNLQAFTFFYQSFHI